MVETELEPRAAQRPFFVPVANDVFTCKNLTRASRQILLILELKAGTSRHAKLSNQQLSKLSGASLRTVERAITKLRKLGYIERRGSRSIQMMLPSPVASYVQVYEGVVHHPNWETWQIHLLLFILSRYRNSERVLGQPLYTLNLFGKRGLSVEGTCRVPGNTKTRRKLIQQFIGQLQSEGVVHIVEPATSNFPAACRVSHEILAEIQPDYDRHRAAACGVTVSTQNPDRQESRRNTVKHHGECVQTSRSNTDTRHVAAPTNDTYAEDPEPFEYPRKILESPRSALPSGRGVISSQVRATSNPEKLSAQHNPPDEVSSGWGDDLASLLEPGAHRDLTAEVELRMHSIGIPESKAKRSDLARKWATLLAELPEETTVEDVWHAIRSAVFDGLKQKSWGLLLSRDFRTRFAGEIRNNVNERRRETAVFDSKYAALCSQLESPIPAERKEAIVDLVDRFGPYRKKIPLLIAKVLIGTEPDAKVRLTAIEELQRLNAQGKIQGKCHELISRIARQFCEDSDERVREEAGYLKSDLSQSAST